MDPSPLQNLISGVGEVFTFLIGKFGLIFQLFIDEPVLLIIFGIFVAGAVIGLVTRIYRNA